MCKDTQPKHLKTTLKMAMGFHGHMGGADWWNVGGRAGSDLYVPGGPSGAEVSRVGAEVVGVGGLSKAAAGGPRLGVEPKNTTPPHAA